MISMSFDKANQLCDHNMVIRQRLVEDLLPVVDKRIRDVVKEHCEEDLALLFLDLTSRWNDLLAAEVKDPFSLRVSDFVLARLRQAAGSSDEDAEWLQDSYLELANQLVLEPRHAGSNFEHVFKLWYSLSLATNASSLPLRHIWMTMQRILSSFACSQSAIQHAVVQSFCSACFSKSEILWITEKGHVVNAASYRLLSGRCDAVALRMPSRSSTCFKQVEAWLEQTIEQAVGAYSRASSGSQARLILNLAGYLEDDQLVRVAEAVYQMPEKFRNSFMRELSKRVHEDDSLYSTGAAALQQAIFKVVLTQINHSIDSLHLTLFQEHAVSGEQRLQELAVDKVHGVMRRVTESGDLREALALDELTRELHEHPAMVNWASICAFDIARVAVSKSDMHNKIYSELAFAIGSDQDLRLLMHFLRLELQEQPAIRDKADWRADLYSANWERCRRLLAKKAASSG